MNQNRFISKSDFVDRFADVKAEMEELDKKYRESAERILTIFLDHSDSMFNLQQIKQHLSVSDPDLAGTVEYLVDKGSLCPAGKKSWALPEKLGMATGYLKVRGGGSGFVISAAERTEIDQRHMGNALDRDKVVVRRFDDFPQFDVRRRMYFYRGRIVRVIGRGREGFSGVARRAGKGWVVDPLDPVLPRPVVLRLPGSGEEPETGRVVYVTLQYEKSGSFHAVLRANLGNISTPAVFIDAVVSDFGIQKKFPENVLEEAEITASTSMAQENRKDLRNSFTITIDPVDARDFDDAVSIQKSGDGFTLGVHIADVAWYVRPGSLLDTEALLRGTSVYLPDRVIPMLPEILSNGACSLRPEEDRLTRSVLLEYDKTGRRLDFSIVPSIIRSDRRLTYDEALNCLKGQTDDKILESLFGNFAELSRLLGERRTDRGSLDLGSSDFRVLFDESGWPSGFREIPDDDAHRMIENFMIEANRAVADFCTWSELPVLYRVHDEPDPDAAEKLREGLREMGVHLPGKRVPQPGELRKLIEKSKDTPGFTLIKEMVLRSMKKAVYSSLNSGHYGLALRSYTHFTSPIRRYPDLYLHQVLQLNERNLMPSNRFHPSKLADCTSSAEQTAAKAERTSDKIMALFFLTRQTGKVFNGVVSGVENFGVFVRLLEVPIEGLIPFWVLKKRGYSSESCGNFRKGESIVVKILSVDIMDRKLTLEPTGKDHERE